MLFSLLSLSLVTDSIKVNAAGSSYVTSVKEGKKTKYYLHLSKSYFGGCSPKLRPVQIKPARTEGDTEEPRYTQYYAMLFEQYTMYYNDVEGYDRDSTMEKFQSWFIFRNDNYTSEGDFYKFEVVGSLTSKPLSGSLYDKTPYNLPSKITYSANNGVGDDYAYSHGQWSFSRCSGEKFVLRIPSRSLDDAIRIYKEKLRLWNDTPIEERSTVGIDPRHETYAGYIFERGEAGYEITFDTNLGSSVTWSNGPQPAVSGQVFTVKASVSDSLEMPTSPSRPGYEFLGWQLFDGNSQFANKTTSKNGQGGVLRLFSSANSGDKISAEALSQYVADNKATFVAIWKHDTTTPLNCEIAVNSPGADAYETPNYSPIDSQGGSMYVSTASEKTDNAKTGQKNSPNRTITGTYKKIDNRVYLTPIYSNAPNNLNFKLQVVPGTKRNEANLTVNAGGNFTVKLSNACGVAIAPANSCSCSCGWYDKWSKCIEGSHNLNVTGRHYSFIGDASAPDMSNLNLIEKYQTDGIDKTKTTSYPIALSATEDGWSNSGVLANNSYTKIVNDDNKKTSSPLGKTSSGGAVPRKLSFATFDPVASENAFGVQNLFNGKWKADFNLVDNVGNASKGDSDSGSFQISANVRSQTYAPKSNFLVGNQIVQKTGTSDNGTIVFRQREGMLLHVEAAGYLNAIEVEFPMDWYNDRTYPLYIYTGDINNYDRTKLERVTTTSIFLTADPSSGHFSKDIYIVTPWKSQTETYKDCKITVYGRRNGQRVIASGQTLKADVNFKTIGKSILDEHRSVIVKTY